MERSRAEGGARPGFASRRGFLPRQAGAFPHGTPAEGRGPRRPPWPAGEAPRSADVRRLRGPWPSPAAAAASEPHPAVVPCRAARPSLALAPALAALAWPAAAAAEVVRSVPADRSLPFAAGVLAAFAVVAGVAVVRLLRRPPARAPRRPAAREPIERRAAEAPPPDPGAAEAAATLARLADLLARAAERGDAPPDAGVGRMVAAAHARDRQTLAHSVRVARYAVALARRLDVADDLANAIEWGALLHDVGKIAVPAEVLHKAGPLTPAERALMRRHPRHGYRLLRDLVFLGPALDVVLSHHERWDGAGYPNRLAGEAIPLAARIFAVADTYDAITSDRPYRPARGHAEAVAELERVAGTQLDPRLVAAFLAIPEPRLAALRDEAAPVWQELERLARGRRAAAR